MIGAPARRGRTLPGMGAIDPERKVPRRAALRRLGMILLVLAAVALALAACETKPGDPDKSEPKNTDGGY